VQYLTARSSVFFNNNKFSIVSQSYFYAEMEHPETTPEVKFFPFENEESWRFIGVPYVKIHLSSKSKSI
jgi:hypothetical protein